MKLRACLLAAALLSVLMPAQARVRTGRNVVRVGFFQSPGWASLASDGTRQGIVPEWAGELARRCGWRLKWVHSVWAKAFDQLERGELDLVVGVASTRPRQDRLLFPSTPFMLFPACLFVHLKSSCVEKGIRGLDGARVGLVAGYFHNDVLRSYLRRKGVRDWTPVTFRSERELDNAFRAGKVDAALGDVAESRRLKCALPLVGLPPVPLFTVASPHRPDLIAEIEYATADVLMHNPDFVRKRLHAHLSVPDDVRPLIDTMDDPDLSRAMVEVARSRRSEDEDLAANVDPSRLSVADLDRVVAVVMVCLAFLGIAGMLLFLRLYRHAQAGLRTRTNFLSLMSHEIRTPLNAVVGFAENMQRPGIRPEQVSEYARGVGDSAQALLALVNDVLDLSKLEANRMAVLDGTCDCGRVFDAMRGVFASRFAAKGIAFTCRVDDMPQVRIREACLRQILLNLLGNAFKFTETGAVSCTATVADEEAGRVTLILVVRDTGTGIPPDKLRIIFDPFTQANTAVRDRFSQGSGLGLAIVHRLVAAAGGTVDVRSEVGKGTAFVVRIPGLAVCGPAAKPAPETPAAIGGRDAASLAVLVVDDVPLNRKILQLHLASLGIRDVRKAEGGPEALAELEKRAADIVLSDVWMPGMDGAELSRLIAARWPQLPIVAVTADTDVSSTFDTSHFLQVLTKPISAERLRTTLCACGIRFHEPPEPAGPASQTTKPGDRACP